LIYGKNNDQDLNYRSLSIGYIPLLYNNKIKKAGDF